MNITFISIFDDEMVEFSSVYKKEANSYYFKDKSCLDTDIKLEIKSEDEIILNRYGNTNMDLDLKLNQYTQSKYINNLGLEFEFNILCKKIDVKTDKIEIEYISFINDNDGCEYKIYILID